MYILVADDKSPDGTRQVVEKHMKKWKNIHLLEGNKEGLGAAYVRAMKYAMETMHADAVVEFDADFQHDPHDIPHLVQALVWLCVLAMGIPFVLQHLTQSVLLCVLDLVREVEDLPFFDIK